MWSKGNAVISKPLRHAVGILAAAVGAAGGARWFFARGDLVPASASALTAFLLCCAVIYLCAPFVTKSEWVGRLASLVHFRFTRQGIVFVLGVLVVAVSALLSANNLLYLVVSCMLGAMVLSGLVTKLGLAGLQLRVSFPPHIFAEETSLARVAVRNLKRWMPSFSIWVGNPGGSAGQTEVVIEEFYCPMIAAGSVAAGSLPVTFQHRGVFRQRAVWLRSRFPFGFVERRTRLDLDREVLVYPSVASSPRVEGIVGSLGSWLQRAAPGDSHDLYRIRPSVSGESARLIDWKASARVGELLVREFSREDQRRLNVVFDRFVPPMTDADKRFEEIVQLCAAVVWRLHHLNAEICFSADDRTILSSPNSGAVHEILRYLALVQPAQEPFEGMATEHQPGPAQRGWFQLVFSTRDERESGLQSSKDRNFSREHKHL